MARTAYMLVLLVLVALVPVCTYAGEHPLIKSVYVENMNPDGTLYLGIEYVMEVGVVPGADMDFNITPVGNKTYEYTYNIMQGKIRFAVFGSPGKYNLTVVAVLGDVVDTYTMLVDFVTFSPAFKVELVNEKLPMSDSPVLVYRVQYLGNGGSLNRLTPAEIKPYINDYVGRIRGKVVPTHVVFGGEITDVYVNMTLDIPETYYPATIEVGLTITSYGMLVGIYKFSVESEEIKEYFRAKPVEIRIEADGYKASFTMRAGKQTYRAEGNTVKLPVLYPVDKVYVNLTITSPRGEQVYSYSNELTYSEYVGELKYWLGQEERTVYFKTDNRTDNLNGVYMVEYPNGTAVETAYVSKILGLPGKPADIKIVPGATLYAKGVYTEIHVPEEKHGTTTTGGGGGGSSGAVLGVLFLAVIVVIIVVVVRRHRGIRVGKKKEAGEEKEGEEAVEISESELESILEKITEEKK